MYKIIISILIILSFAEVVKGQDGNNTMFFLSNLPQRVRLNPAYQPEYKVFVGLPVLSGVAFNYNNSAFGIDKILSKTRNDSLMVDVNKLYKSLNKRNFMLFNTELSILSVGVKNKDWYFTFDVVEKNDMLFRFNKDLITFFKNGNADYLGKNFDCGRLGLNANLYNEFALGASRKINDKLVVGARVKFLMGIANAKMTDSKLNIKTSSDGEKITINSEQNIRVSMPLKYTMTGEYVDWDGFEFDDNNLGVSTVLNSGNLGFGIDLGGEYQFMDKLRFHASLLDLGFIHWGSNAYTFTQNSTYDWTGADLTNSIVGDDKLEDAFDDMLDTLENQFRFKDGGSGYTTMLHAKLNLGATYDVCKMLNVGALFRATMLDKAFYPSFTVSANARLLRNVSATVSYTATLGSYANVGAGLTAKLGPVQLYAMTDNVLAANYTHTQSVSARVGINLLFGHKDKKKKVKENETTVVTIAIPPKATPQEKPKEEIKEEVKEQEPVVVAPVDTVVEEIEAPVEEMVAEPEKPDMVYVVIVGSFANERSAMALKREFVKKGFTKTQMLRNKNGLFQVGVDVFDDELQARAVADEIKQKNKAYQDAWVLEQELK